MRDIQQIATELAAMQPEELAILYEAWDEERFNKRVSPLISAFRDLELTTQETDKLIKRLKNIAWCEEQRQLKGDGK
jgi:hypothetical protein